MYNVVVPGAVATTVAGGELVNDHVLPFTGFAFGAYLAVALALIVIGVVLKIAGRRPRPAA